MKNSLEIITDLEMIREVIEPYFKKYYTPDSEKIEKFIVKNNQSLKDKTIKCFAYKKDKLLGFLIVKYFDKN